MPIHEWTRVEAGLFHAFRQGWISNLCCALNKRRLRAGYFALIEQVPQGRIPDFLELDLSPGREEFIETERADSPSKTCSTWRVAPTLGRRGSTTDAGVRSRGTSWSGSRSERW